MGIYLNQLPPAEVARLKAELAETLIANFCYPRFYDYRINALRMRPVDRAKRQEVWQYLSAVDFNVWGRVDLLSPDFQRQVERLFIHFVQRNRTFFGEQGRKRMFDVRMLITISSSKVVEGLRGHLTGQQTVPPFGSPRPVSSWSTTNITGRQELNWEQIATATMLLQQQMQEVRGEVRSGVPVLPAPAEIRAEIRPAPASSWRTGHGRSNSNGTGNGALDVEMARSASGKATAQEARRIAPSLPGSRVGSPVAPAAQVSMVPPSPPPPSRHLEQTSASEEVLLTPTSPTLPASPRNAPLSTSLVTQVTSPIASTPSPSLAQSVSPTPRVSSLPQPSIASTPIAEREISRTIQPPASPPEPQKEAAVHAPEDASALVGEEDIMIFEQLQKQLMIWLRIEAVRSGITIAEQGSFQLLERLGEEDGYDAARLQVISTLLKLTDQVISSGRGSLLDYKQALMFYLMHTRRSHF